MAAAEHRDHWGGPPAQEPRNPGQPAQPPPGQEPGVGCELGQGDRTVPEGLAPFLPLRLMPPRAGACWGDQRHIMCLRVHSAVFGQSGCPPWRPSLPPPPEAEPKPEVQGRLLSSWYLFFFTPPLHNLYIPKYVQLRWGVFKEGVGCVSLFLLW